MRRQGWAPDVAAELSDYFRTTESVNGLASSWEPLVGIAQGGAVVRTDPEAKFHAGGRFALGPHSRTAVSRHREVRDALLRLPEVSAGALAVLWAAHGPVAWARIVKAGLGEETAGKLGDLFDERLYGVALLTPEFHLHTGPGRWAGPTPVRKDDKRGKVRAWHAPGAWLADLALVAKSRSAVVSEERRANAVALLSEVGRSALGMLRVAEDAYRSVRRRPPAPVLPELTRRQRRLVGLDGIDFDAGGPAGAKSPEALPGEAAS